MPLFDYQGNPLGSGGVQTDPVPALVAENTQSLVNTCSGVFALYDALVTAYPDYVSKHTLTENGLTNYEYRFKTPTINSYADHTYAMDAEVVKPKLLLSTGTHGYEQSAVMSAYVFLKNLASGAESLRWIREGVEIRILPIVSQYAYDHDSRYNANGVDINRNFNANWTASGSPYYSGTGPASENETKLAQAWIDANTDAVMHVDYHNSEIVNEILCLMSMGASEKIDVMQDSIVQSLYSTIAHWHLDRELVGSNIVPYYFGDDTTRHGWFALYSQHKGIPGFVIETSWNVKSTGKHSTATIATGAEACAGVMRGFVYSAWAI